MLRTLHIGPSSSLSAANCKELLARLNKESKEPVDELILYSVMPRNLDFMPLEDRDIILEHLEQLLSENSTVTTIKAISFEEGLKHNAETFVKTICENPNSKVKEINLSCSLLSATTALKVALLCYEKQIKVELCSLGGAGNWYDCTLKKENKVLIVEFNTTEESASRYLSEKGGVVGILAKMPNTKLIINARNMKPDDIEEYLAYLKQWKVSVSVEIFCQRNEHRYRYSPLVDHKENAADVIKAFEFPPVAKHINLAGVMPPANQKQAVEAQKTESNVKKVVSPTS